MRSKLVNILFAAAWSFISVAAVAVAVVKIDNIHNEKRVEAAGFAPGYTPKATYTFGDEATYYTSISDSASGSTLLTSLQSLNSNRRKRTTGYSDGGTSASSSSFVYTDYASVAGYDKNGAPYGTAISSFYTYTTATSFNKEHVWPNSRGGGTVDNDIHMARPTISSENSSRGNSFYVEGKNTQASGWDPYTAGYTEVSRGESARIIFYCMVANPSLNLIDQNGLSSSESGYKTTMGKLSDLLKWNLSYAVTSREKNRNNGAEYLQGNRNPFIDHPEYACKIWGNTNSTTKSICGGSTISSTVTLNKSTASIEVGTSVSLAATSSNGGTITWTTDNDNASLSSSTGSTINVVGAKAGTTTVTAKNTDGATATCKITITGQTEKIKVNLTSVNLAIDESVDLIATTNDGSPVTYAFEDDDKAYDMLFFDFGDNIPSGTPYTLTGVKDGTVNLVVSSSNGGSVTIEVVVGDGVYKGKEGNGSSENNENNKTNPSISDVNLPLVIGLGAGGGVVLIAGITVLIIFLVKRKHV